MRKGIKRFAAMFLAVLAMCVVPTVAFPQPQPPPASVQPYGTAQLDQLVSPIALYPDGLLGQVLMASTYPLEVVEAARWIQDPANAALRGDALTSALEPINWDPSVKALAPFPSVLQMMSGQLEWMQQLGDAFLAQQAEVMDAVQRLRRQAVNAGTLVSTPQQTVTTVDGIIYIEPASPDVLYVPAYDPDMVYGAWPYPEYPPYFFPPPSGYDYGPLSNGIGFGIGFVIIQTFWGWDHCDWQHHRIDVDAHRVNLINRYYIERFHLPQFTGREWRHSPQHRVGVPYRSPQVRERFERRQSGSLQNRNQYRGYRQPPTNVSPQVRERFERRQPLVGGPARPAPRPAERNGPRPAERSSPPVMERPPAPIYQRSRNGAEAREYSNRGRQSRQSMPRPGGPSRSQSQGNGRSRSDQRPGR